MPKIILPSVGTNYSATQLINANFAAIAEALNDHVLYRDNIEPRESNSNFMENILDMNSNCIINVCAPTNKNDVAIYDNILTLTQQLEDCKEDLQAQIDGKADDPHTHTESEITDLDKYTQAQVNALLSGKAAVNHEHPRHIYVQPTDPSGSHSWSNEFLWVETDGAGCPVTFWVGS